MRTLRWALFLALIAGASALASSVALPPFAAQPGEPGDVEVVGLETNAAVQPLGIDDRAPRFSWRLVSDQRGVMQDGFRVLVASTPDLLNEDRADVWDSGEVVSSDPFVIYQGPSLESRTRYHWTVRVRATPGGESHSVSATWFETALLDPWEWKGQWIAGPERPGILTPAEGEADDESIRAADEFCRPVAWLTTGFAAKLVENNQGECRELRPAPRLRRSFTIDKDVEWARVYTSGLAYLSLAINGALASDRVLDPGFTDYSRTVLYTTDDVSALLKQGENVLAVELGSGQFDSATRTWDWSWDQAEWRGRPRLRLNLHLRFTDGSEEIIATDHDWKASVDGPTRYDSYYLGETYDARREQPGWDSPGFDDANWASAHIVSSPAGAVRAQVQEPIRVVSERSPGRLSEPSPGVFVYDVGQMLTGWARVRVRAAEGTAVELFYSEKLTDDGRASTTGNDLVFGQLQTDYYVAKGAGEEVWAPRFTYKGFRYLQVSGPAGASLDDEVSVVVERILQVRSDLPRTSTFDSDQSTLNRIHRNTMWAVQNNIHGVITDTPVYEKNAWTGDAQLMAGTTSLLFDTERLYRKLSQDMRDAQTELGEVPLLAPSNDNYGYAGKPAFKPIDCCGATPAWDAFWFVVPWESYRRYGDIRTLAQTYPAMRRYLDDWIPRWVSKDEDDYRYTLTSGLGDWVAPEGVPTVNALAATAYYAHLAGITADVARALGQPEEAAEYDALVGRIREDFNARFLAESGIYEDNAEDNEDEDEQDGEESGGFVQSAQILPLAFGLVPESRRSTVAAALADDLEHERDGNPWVGVLGARYVLPVLTATGHHDLALTVATQTDEPSWGFWTDEAEFTSLGEHWRADTRSRNHHFFGAIVQWFYEDLAGIRPLEPGYRRVAFDPQIPASGLNRVEATYESVRGTVASRWRRTETALELAVVVPPNATGRVYVPASSADAVSETSGSQPVSAEQAEGVQFVGTEGDRIVYDVGSGRYVFRIASNGVAPGR